MPQSHLVQLPTEVLMQLLTPFGTHELLRVALICKRFHNLVLRIVHHRLALAASLRDHKIIFECFHPTQKNIDPYLFCNYLGTPGLSSDTDKRDEPVYFEADGQTGFRRLGNLYSHFRPVAPEEMARLRRPHPAWQSGSMLQQHDEAAHQPWGSGRILANEPRLSEDNDEDEDVILASYPVNLDHDDGFTQLSMVTNLVKIGPYRGLFERFVPVSDNTTRLKRDWLKSVAASTLNVDVGVQNAEEDELRTMWIDDAKNIALKVRLKERTIRRSTQYQPLLYRESEPAVSYTMEYDVLLIRTTRLLLAVEKALLQDRNDGNGKALIIGSFASQMTQQVPNPTTT